MVSKSCDRASNGSRRRSMVGYDANPAPGENRQRTTYAPDPANRNRLAPQDSTMNVVGFNDSLADPNCILCGDALKQGGSISRALNMVPGANAVGRLDDWLNYQVPSLLGDSVWFKALTIPAAYAVTAPALLDRVPVYNPSRR